MSLPAPNAGFEALEASGAFGAADWRDLREAVELLEAGSLASRLSQMVGRRLKFVTAAIPQGLSDVVARAVDVALRGAMKTAIRSLGERPSNAAGSVYAHRAMAAAAGAAGGALGFAALPVELPFSTTLMLRAIADTARAQGEDLSNPDAALACIEVFALGGEATEKPLESGYFAVRGLFAKTISEAARFVMARGAAEEGAPVLARLVSMIGARYGALVTQKAIAQAVPVVGALSAAAINYAFMEHFQKVARGHFIVRRLEREYGAEKVREAFDQLRLAGAGDRARTL